MPTIISCYIVPCSVGEKGEQWQPAHSLPSETWAMKLELTNIRSYIVPTSACGRASSGSGPIASASSGWQLWPVIVRSYSSQSSACWESEQRQPVLSLLSEMRVAHTPISACEKCEQLQPAKSLLSEVW